MRGMEKDIYNRFQQLPSEKKEEVKDFVDFLLEKVAENTKKQGKKRKLGQMRGTVQYISPDFDAPLGRYFTISFKEWMTRAIEDLQITILPIITKDKKIAGYDVETHW